MEVHQNQNILNEDGPETSLDTEASPHKVAFDNSVVVSNKSADLPIKSFQEMCNDLFQCLTDDILAADAKWSLFIAASQSYRHDSCLKPFPPIFFTQSRDKDINLLLKVIDKIPSFIVLRKLLNSPDIYQLDDFVIQLLHWVLIQLPEPTLKTVPKNQFDHILDLVKSECSAKKPDLIFEVKYARTSANYIKWNKYKNEYKSLFAYHGSRLENFHSIINYGLQLSLTKTALFGQGVYLSSELLVSLPYSSTGFGWGKSMMGAELSVVALCEVLDHPSVHRQTEEAYSKDRAMASDSMAGEVPHKYYLVSNSEMIRIRNLLVYTRSPPQAYAHNLVPKNTYFNWLKRHKLLTCIMGYVFLLTSVGLSNNPVILKYYRSILHKAGME